MLAACEPDGSGILVTETRDVGGTFNRIDAREGVTVDVTVDVTAVSSVSVTYDDNLIDRISTRLVDATLVIDVDGRSLGSTGDGRAVTVVMAELDQIKTGSGSNVTARGAADRYEVEATSGSNVDAGNLNAAGVFVDVSSGANVVVRATDEVVGEASSGSNVDVLGNPASVDIDDSSGSNVNVRP